VCLVIGAFLLAACGEEPDPPPPPPPPPPPVIAVYGDSLMVESFEATRTRLAEVLPGWDVLQRTWGGTAQCDWHDDMQADAASSNIKAVVIAFSGNYLTPCIQSRPLAEGYMSDANWALDFWWNRNVPVLLVAAPGPIDQGEAARVGPHAYLNIAAYRGSAMVDTGPLFFDTQTQIYGATMPCLVGECSGTTQVRRADGHLCPFPTNNQSCPVYSSGVVRYAESIAYGVSHMLGGSRTAVTMVPPPPTTTTTSSTSSTTSSTSTTSTTSTSTTTSSTSTTTTTTLEP